MVVADGQMRDEGGGLSRIGSRSIAKGTELRQHRRKGCLVIGDAVVERLVTTFYAEFGIEVPFGGDAVGCGREDAAVMRVCDDER